MEGLSRFYRLAECRVVDRNVRAPAEDGQAFLGGDFFEGFADKLAAVGVARHEQHADAVFAGLRQRDAERRSLAGEKLVRDLHQDAGAVAGARIGANRAAMFKIDQDRQRIFDDLLRLAALDVGDESDAAGILGECGVVKTVTFRRAGIGGIGIERARVDKCDGFSPLALACPLLTHSRRSHGTRYSRTPAHHPRSPAPFDAAAQGKPELEAAFRGPLASTSRYTHCQGRLPHVQAQ